MAQLAILIKNCSKKYSFKEQQKYKENRSAQEALYDFGLFRLCCQHVSWEGRKNVEDRHLLEHKRSVISSLYLQILILARNVCINSE